MNSHRLAKIISLVSSPFLIIPIFGLAVAASYAASFAQFAGWSGLFIVLNVGLPLAYIAWGVKNGRITDLHVMVRGQRIEPFLLATAGSVVLGVTYKVMKVPDGLFAMAITFAVTGIILTIATYWWKVSIHAAAYSGAVLMVAGLINWALLWLGLFLPVIIWARLKRGRHNIGQALVAVIIVSACVLTTLYLLGRF